MTKINKPRLQYTSIKKAAFDAVQYIDDRRKGLIKSLKTPWSKYNHVSMDGIEWNTIHTIAGMSGSGKTAIINQLETVEPTKGDTDFNLIFKCLKKINFDGLYTLQTARMEDGKEIETIKRHKKIIEGIYND